MSDGGKDHLRVKNVTNNLVSTFYWDAHIGEDPRWAWLLPHNNYETCYCRMQQTWKAAQMDKCFVFVMVMYWKDVAFML